MLDSSVLRWLIAVIVAITVPSIACFGFYSLDAAGEVGKRWPYLVILAYPVALIGLIWLLASVLSARYTLRGLLFPTACFAIPALFLLVIRM